MSAERQLGTGMLWVAALLLLGVLYLLFAGLSSPEPGSYQSSVAGGVAEVVLQENELAHYLADGSINGEPVRFLVDTGASSVALSRSLAQRIGVEATARTQVSTANGVVNAGAARLDSVQLGPIEVRDVLAVIVPNMDDEVLLGMSFLRELDFERRGGDLILRRREE